MKSDKIVNMRKEVMILIIGGVIIAILAGILVFGKNPKKDFSKITDFESCAKAGNPVFQSYPRMCKTSDGRTFTE